MPRFPPSLLENRNGRRACGRGVISSPGSSCWRNRFKVHWSFLYIAIIDTFVSFGHTLIRWLQEAILGRRIRKTKITEPPIFILGHWRTGTTLLHELLIRDERFSYPNTYECMEPNHFLLTEGLFTRFFWFLMPAHRPMDNMKAGFDRPQEDEFALCMLGQPSPYLTIAFPNNPPQGEKYLDLEGLSAGTLRSWKRTFKQFLKQVTYKGGKRLVLKSPPHTARIKVLKDMFPGALFIHIVRDPYVVFPSTVNLWKSLYRTHGLQKPTFAGLEEYVLRTYTRLYQRLEEGKKLLAPNQFYELRYEDMIKRPGRGNAHALRALPARRLRSVFAAPARIPVHDQGLRDEQVSNHTRATGARFRALAGRDRTLRLFPDAVRVPDGSRPDPFQPAF